MFERFIFADEIERAGTRQLICDAFPLALVWTVPDPEADDFLLDMYAPVDEHLFFRWAISTHGPARLLIYSCYRMSLLLLEPPEWMKQEIKLSQRLLTDGQ